MCCLCCYNNHHMTSPIFYLVIVSCYSYLNSTSIYITVVRYTIIKQWKSQVCCLAIINHHQLRLNDNSGIQGEENPELSLKNTTTSTTNVVTPSSERDRQLAFKLESMCRQINGWNANITTTTEINRWIN
jgi:hypothetical protein